MALKKKTKQDEETYKIQVRLPNALAKIFIESAKTNFRSKTNELILILNKHYGVAKDKRKNSTK